MGDSPGASQSDLTGGNQHSPQVVSPEVLELRERLAAQDIDLQTLKQQLSDQRRPFTVSEVSDCPPGDGDDPFGVMFKPVEREGNGEASDIFAELADVEQTTEYGPPILDNIANGIKTTVSRALSKDTASQLAAKFKVPDNCKGLAVPRMNKEVWMHLPTKARVQDVNLQSMQQTLAQGLIGLSSIANIVGNKKDLLPEAVGKEILRAVMDTANLLGSGFQGFNQKRKNEVKMYMKPECASICDAALPVTELLFGDNLKEALQTSKAAAQVMRTSSVRERPRSRPYERPRPSSNYQSTPLNRQAPPPQYRRGGWNNRMSTPKSYHNRGNRPQGGRHY